MTEQTSDQTSDPDAIVKCRICEREFARKALLGHVGAAHKPMNKAKYLEQYPEAVNDFHKYVPGEASLKALDKIHNPPPIQEPLPDGASVMERLLLQLKPTERQFVDDFMEKMFQQVDRDEMQVPTITDLAIETVMLMRLRDTQLKALASSKKDDVAAAKLASEQVKVITESIRKSMDKLGVSREAKLKNKVQVKSTAMSLLSGYMDEIERFSPEVLSTLKTEEEKALAAMFPRVQKLILDVAPDMEETPEQDALDLEALLKRADVPY